MDSATLLVAVLAVAMLLLVAYFYLRDKEATRKSIQLEKSIDMLTKEMYELSKTQALLAEKLGEKGEAQVVTELPAQQVDDRIMQKLRPFAVTFQHLETKIDALQKNLDDKVRQFDGRLRQVTLMSEHADIDEAKVVRLHNEGKSVDEIAKAMRIGTGEVELVLRFFDIKS